MTPSIFFYHNSKILNDFRAELNIAPGIVNLKSNIIENIKHYFGDVYEFPYEYASVELPEIGYGNNGIITKNGRKFGITPMTLFNAFFSDMYIYG